MKPDMKRLMLIFYGIGMICLLSDCNEAVISNDFYEVLIPFQEDKGGFWGFMTLKGEVKIAPTL